VTPATSSVILYTSVVTETPSSAGGTAQPTTIFITSTASQTVLSSSVGAFSPVSGTASSSSTRSSALATVAASSSSTSSGLSTGGIVAVAVIVPIAAIVLLILGFLFFWKKRKARLAAEEERKKEIEEYGFNPNQNPTLTPAGAAVYAANGSEMTEENTGYRGWGAASTQRKLSTHLSSGRGAAVGAAPSDSSSNPGGYGYQASPSNGTTAVASEGHSGDPLVHSETVGALAGAGAAGGAVGRRQSNKDIHRGPSNASSAYSTGRAQSHLSDDMAPPGPGAGAPGPYYHEEGPYYNEAAPQHSPYGDGSYGGEQPVIRDVQARRNTRIERAPAFPQQGNSGVATNF
jgi:hypothetical protein